MPLPLKVMPGQRGLKYVHTFAGFVKSDAAEACTNMFLGSVWGFIHCLGLCRCSQL